MAIVELRIRADEGIKKKGPRKIREKGKQIILLLLCCAPLLATGSASVAFLLLLLPVFFGVFGFLVG